MTTDNAQMLDELCELVIQVSPEPVTREELSEETRYTEDLAMDSITLVALMFLCEEHFQINVANSAEKIATLATLGLTIDFIKEADKL